MKRRVSILILGLVICVAFFAQAAQAQGHFVRHGFQVDMPEFALGKKNSVLVFRAGYHVFGAIELGLGLERREDFDAKIVTVSLTPGLAVYPLRQSERVPITLRVGVAYENQAISGDPITTLEESGVLTAGSAFRWEGGISRRISDVGLLFGFPVDFVPVVSFLYRSVTIDQGEDETKSRYSTVDLKAVFDLDVGGMAHVTVGPRFGIFDDSFGAGFVIGLAAGYPY